MQSALNINDKRHVATISYLPNKYEILNFKNLIKHSNVCLLVHSLSMFTAQKIRMYHHFLLLWTCFFIIF